jgi:uncharacterized protein YjbJ (UPF0337 family)
MMFGSHCDHIRKQVIRGAIRPPEQLVGRVRERRSKTTLPLKGEADMDWDQLEGRWKEFAGSARAHWSKLTDDDWQAITGKKEHLVGLVQKRYGIAKDEAERQVDAWSSALQNIVEGSKKH